ncbi:hypothetical protein QR98_0062010 [Sarcoptes scabiei]|uniref:Uncharacterized protein n=1 Tax=Sarcoptes scabiei TaxID=52283 RepID=A0A132A9S7_SARSC|nr:hypothetical protein QR98_0062010 [Sarcoptes scabiei]
MNLFQLNFNQCLQSTRKFFLAHPHPPPPSSPFSPPSSEDNYLDPMISPNKRDLKDILMPPPSPQDHSFPSSIHDPDHFDGI